MKRVVSLSLNERLLERIDAARGDVPRSAYVERALDGVIRPNEAPRPPLAASPATSTPIPKQS